MLVSCFVKPFSMAVIGWFFFRIVFLAWIPSTKADQYIAGAVILAAAPCAAMVFVWIDISGGSPAYMLVRISANDLAKPLLFAPIVRFPVSGASSPAVSSSCCHTRSAPSL